MKNKGLRLLFASLLLVATSGCFLLSEEIEEYQISHAQNRYTLSTVTGFDEGDTNDFYQELEDAGLEFSDVVFVGICSSEGRDIRWPGVERKERGEEVMILDAFPHVQCPAGWIECQVTREENQMLVQCDVTDLILSGEEFYVIFNYTALEVDTYSLGFSPELSTEVLGVVVEDEGGDDGDDGFGPVDPADVDGDGILNADDNCPGRPNPDQADADGDGIGDACLQFRPFADLVGAEGSDNGAGGGGGGGGCMNLAAATAFPTNFWFWFTGPLGILFLLFVWRSKRSNLRE